MSSSDVRRPNGDSGEQASHVRASTPHGPDYCMPCSEAAAEWVPWEGHLSNAATTVDRGTE